jgi:hypothetical protein
MHVLFFWNILLNWIERRIYIYFHLHESIYA